MNTVRTFLGITIVLLLVAAIVSSTEARSWDNWRELGSVKANHHADHDRIEIKGPHDTFRKIKLRVEGSDLHLRKLVVVYDDGAPENIQIRNDIQKGGESRAIDLKGGKRKLRSVEFWFEAKGFLSGKAEVFLYGSK